MLFVWLFGTGDQHLAKFSIRTVVVNSAVTIFRRCLNAYGMLGSIPYAKEIVEQQRN